MLEIEKKVKELHLQYSVIQAALKKISKLTKIDIKDEKEAIYTINKWATNNKASLEEIAPKYRIQL